MTAQGSGSCDEFEKTNIHIEGAVSLMKKLEEYEDKRILKVKACKNNIKEIPDEIENEE